MSPLRRLVRSLPAVSRRDERIDRLLERQGRLIRERDRLRRTVEELEQQLAAKETPELTLGIQTRPGFAAQLAVWKRDINRNRRAKDLSDPRSVMTTKLEMYRFAESHGLKVPTVHGLWATPEEIDLDTLPERFVIKSDRGSSGHGVLPVERVDGGYRIFSRTQIWHPEGFHRLLRRRLDEGRIAGPFFVESLMEDSRHPGRLPVDVKLYSFYGTVGHVLLREMEHHADRSTARLRYLGADGTDLGRVTTWLETSSAVEPPSRLPELVEVARRLSAAVPLPFVRVDLYDLPDGIWFGELTLTPGGRQAYTAEHDAELGLLWEDAATRLARDHRAGRPFTLTFGDHPVRTPRAGDVPATSS